MRPTRLPSTRAGGCSAKISTPGRTAGADAQPKVAATSKAVVRVMNSVTCYAPRPRLQPHAGSVLVPSPRTQCRGAEASTRRDASEPGVVPALGARRARLTARPTRVPPPASAHRAPDRRDRAPGALV